jgi:hypothetical protein
MNPGISASVGFGGVNRPPDVKTIQGLLNLIPTLVGGPLAQLVVDGLCGPKTNGAIRGFQQKQFGFADGRIDPGQQTIQKILALLNAPSPNTGIHSFSGFNGEQETILKQDIDRAVRLLGQTRDLCALAPFMKGDNHIVKMLLFNFSIDFTSNDNPIATAFNSTMLMQLQASLAKLLTGMQQPLTFKFDPLQGGLDPDAFVLFPDPTIFIKPQYFEKTDPVERSVVLVHERAHSVLQADGHPGMGGGLAVLVVEPQDDKRPFFQPRGHIFDNAIRNPFNYEWLISSLEHGPRRIAPMQCTRCAQ